MTTQLTLNFKPGVSDAFESCREYVQFRVFQIGKPQKAIAADMDYAPSTLSRKLAQSPSDSQRFTLDDLEAYMQTTDDTEPVLYLVEKYLTSTKEDEIKRLKEKLKELEGAAG